MTSLPICCIVSNMCVYTTAMCERQKIKETRMHSSRMRTIRSSSHLPLGGICLSACWDTNPPPPGQTPPGSRHTTLGPGPPRSRYSPLGPDHPPQDQTPPCGQTHACENITFATSLRSVKIAFAFAFALIKEP